MKRPHDEALWNGERGAGGISWEQRSRMGPLRGVIDAADYSGRRNLYMHTLHVKTLERELERAGGSGRALDFGCGTGRFIGTLARRFAYVAATDKEPAMVQAARRYAGRYGAEIVTCNPTAIQFETGYFDFVLCSSVLCVTLPHLLDAIVAELARVIRPGGTLMLLEQVSQDRGLAASRYYDALRACGFKLARAYPIRFSGSKFTTLAARSWIPISLLEPMAAVELYVTARRRWGSKRTSYVEYAIVARRR